MRLSQYIEREPSKRRASPHKKRGSASSRSLATHGLFVPIVTVWGAALFGLIVAVLPEAGITRITMVTGVELGRYVVAGLAAVLGAAFATVIAGALRTQALNRLEDDALVSAVHSRRHRPINPTADLGSESLDAPLETMPFSDAPFDLDDEDILDEPPLLAEKPKAGGRGEGARQPTLGELSQRGYEIEPPAENLDENGKPKKNELAFTHKQYRNALIESCEGATCEAAAEVRAPAAAAPSTRLPDAPQQLDLSEFAQLPGRNAVWVEEPVDTAAEPAPARSARPAVPPASALERLRQTPPEELSLVEMVERFAAALHERQKAERERTSAAAITRDQALAEALRALTVFTGAEGATLRQQQHPQPQPRSQPDPQIASTERDLREALAQLQNLRGAA